MGSYFFQPHSQEYIHNLSTIAYNISMEAIHNTSSILIRRHQPFVDNTKNSPAMNFAIFCAALLGCISIAGFIALVQRLSISIRNTRRADAKENANQDLEGIQMDILRPVLGAKGGQGTPTTQPSRLRTPLKSYRGDQCLTNRPSRCYQKWEKAEELSP